MSNRRKGFGFPVRVTWHAYEKLRRLDLTAAKFEILLAEGRVIEETVPRPHLRHELLLLVNWIRPLHVAAIVDMVERVEIVRTVYEPDPGQWSRDFRRRL